MAATLITATVKYSAGQPRQTQYGERINAVLTLPDGDEHKVWGNPGDATIASLRKGQQVQLLKTPKGYKLVTTSTEPTTSADRPNSSTPPPAPVEPITPDIAEIVAIFRELQAALPEAREDTVRAFTSTVFMQRRRSEEF